jgi:hypothetical protein
MSAIPAPPLRPAAQPPDAPCTTAVGNLPYDMTENDLGNLFGEVGPVKHVRCGAAFPLAPCRPPAAPAQALLNARYLAGS